MNKKPTKQQLVERVAELSVDWYQKQSIAKALRAQLNDEYQCYFRANGEPEPGYRRIKPDDPAYEGVINFTNQTYERLAKGRQDKNSAKRRLETAVRALMNFTGETVRVPRKAYVPRANINGETLQ